MWEESSARVVGLRPNVRWKEASESVPPMLRGANLQISMSDHGFRLATGKATNKAESLYTDNGRMSVKMSHRDSMCGVTDYPNIAEPKAAEIARR